MRSEEAYQDIGPIYRPRVLGFEVDKPSKILIKTCSIVGYIVSDIQNRQAPRIDDPII